MVLTDQQQHIVDLAIQGTPFIKCSAIAGGGKTSTALAVSQAIGGRQLYTSFMKSAVVEASEKFPDGVCKTTHSICYRDIVPLGKGMTGIKYGPRKVGFFGYRDIGEAMNFESKLFVVETIENFFTSDYISLKEFIADKVPDQLIAKLVTKYVQAMINKEIPITHGGYMKYYHILLSRGVIIVEPYDLIILDEGQDSSECALAIFNLLPAKVKLFIGDPFQSCMAFANSVNGFHYFADKGATAHLSETRRCSTEIAANIEVFGKRHLDTDFIFTGQTIEDKKVTTQVYIARTNASLVRKMIELNETHTPYNLSRKVKDLFKMVLTIISLKPENKPPIGEYKFLHNEMLTYHRGKSARDNQSLLSYIMNKHGEDKELMNGCKTIAKFGAKKIYETYNYALAHETSVMKYNLSLGTPHSVKGGTWDEAIIDEDMYPEFLIDSDKAANMSEEEVQQELNLIYIAASRARVKVTGMDWLTKV